MNKKQILDLGYNHADGIPECNREEIVQETVNRLLKDKYNGSYDPGFNYAQDVYYNICSEAEDNSRQYSPFEFTAKELNELEEVKDYDVWEIFEEGICMKFDSYWEDYEDEILQEVKDLYDETITEGQE